METTLYIVLSLGFSAMFLFYGIKLMAIYSKFRQSRFKDTKAEFFCDCYKLVEKWAKRGEQDYCIAMHQVIAAFNKDSKKEEEPATQYGKDVITALKEQALSEFQDDIDQM